MTCNIFTQAYVYVSNLRNLPIRNVLKGKQKNLRPVCRGVFSRTARVCTLTSQGHKTQNFKAQVLGAECESRSESECVWKLQCSESDNRYEYHYTGRFLGPGPAATAPLYDFN